MNYFKDRDLSTLGLLETQRRAVFKKKILLGPVDGGGLPRHLDRRRHLRRRPHPPLPTRRLTQAGVGANGENINDGASAWLSYGIEEHPTSGSLKSLGKGTLKVDLECN